MKNQADWQTSRRLAGMMKRFGELQIGGLSGRKQAEQTSGQKAN
ncbi:hypothetical protein HMPREF0201_03354 [Cedecea davisae DSM 4568]|uniref:Uncharacterized protein n=1 Tax=Cedecea davisae DSM 4568 TaxID=566551 RepID=S3JQ72_9ENTR|nr:hypothetical protein HMPREF0201_03354 [Cedecea davisae DSM 4568]